MREHVETSNEVKGSALSRESSSDPDALSELEPMPKKQRVVSNKKKYCGSATWPTRCHYCWEKTYYLVTISTSKGTVTVKFVTKTCP